ncbi:hypothetical protein BOC37_20830 [Burkholderia pseudomallei]|nr:hypothetical protein BOC37_20830 [Burkholderia pseudomallei]
MRKKLRQHAAAARAARESCTWMVRRASRRCRHGARGVPPVRAGPGDARGGGPQCRKAPRAATIGRPWVEGPLTEACRTERCPPAFAPLPEHPNTRTPEHPNARTPERPNARTPERPNADRMSV